MKKDTFNILFSCIGRRVSLLESFRKAAKELKIHARFLGTDTAILSPALQLCDQGFLVKPINEPGYIRQMLSIIKNNQVQLLVPTIDTELKILAENQKKFAAIGCRVLISSEEVIDICRDKRQTYRFLIKNGFESPITMSAGAALAKSNLHWPCLLKPWDGSAGKDIALVRNHDELTFYARKIKNAICQEYIEGDEYTCDVYVDFEKKVRCIVPRKRLEVRAGEVSKSQIVKNPDMMNQAAKLVEALGAGPGVITIQLFLTKGHKLKFTEINPRFGGGAPLSIKAGANFPKWILQELLGQKPNIKFDDFKDGLTMLRYDSEVWIK
ncbi:MAG: ATP-grasp domain-containing protein [Sedimentisphaerales bacterium]|nr:ATP-grasp domain-containing protein [Sedimentisphaerales bacterium]